MTTVLKISQHRKGARLPGCRFFRHFQLPQNFGQLAVVEARLRRSAARRTVPAPLPLSVLVVLVFRLVTRHPLTVAVDPNLRSGHRVRTRKPVPVLGAGVAVEVCPLSWNKVTRFCVDEAAIRLRVDSWGLACLERRPGLTVQRPGTAIRLRVTAWDESPGWWIVPWGKNGGARNGHCRSGRGNVH